MEISENLAYMFGQNFKKFAQSFRTTAGIGRKCQFLFGLLIRPQKSQICSDWLQKQPDHFQFDGQTVSDSQTVSAEIATIHAFIWLHDKVRDSTNVSAIGQPGMCATFTPTLGVHHQYYLNYSVSITALLKVLCDIPCVTSRDI